MDKQMVRPHIELRGTEEEEEEEEKEKEVVVVVGMTLSDRGRQ